MKRVNWSILSRLLLLVLLGACTPAGIGSGDPTLRIITAIPRSTATPTITPTPRVPEIDPAEFDGLELDFWYVWEPASPDALAEVITWFNAENSYGIQVVPRAFTHPEDFETAMLAALQTSDIPQLALAFPYQYLTWQPKDALVDLTPIIESPTYGLSESQIADLYPVFWRHDVYGAQRWAYPGLFYGQVLLYNHTWAQRLGFSTPPQSAAAFTQQACAASEANQDGTGGWIISTAPGKVTAWLLAYVPSLEAGTGYAFDAPEVESAFTFLSGLKEAGCAWWPSEPYPDEAFVERKGLFYSVTTREIPFVQAVFADVESRDQWQAIAYPNDRGEAYISVYGRSYVVLNSSLTEQVAAWFFIQYMTGERSQAYLSLMDGYFPLDRNTAARLQSEGEMPAQWMDSLDFLENARFEPRLASWGQVRAVVQDAAAEVLGDSATFDNLTLILRQLIKTAADLNQ